MEKLGNSMINHPHCYQWTLALLALFLLVAVTTVASGIVFGFVLGLAVYAQIKRTLAASFHVA